VLDQVAMSKCSDNNTSNSNNRNVDTIVFMIR
jgi:hypothetical protein